MRKYFCVTFTIDYLLGLPDPELAGALVRKADGRSMDAAEIRGLLKGYKAEGYEGVPLCSNADSRGYCGGHEVDETMCG